jgi:cobalt-zinc-cadmium efflux system membrane fusion protein
MALDRIITTRNLAVAVAALVTIAAGGSVLHATTAHAAEPGTVKLEDSQLGAIKIGIVADHDFLDQKSAVGIIDFDQDLNTQVFSPYQGRIIQTYADLGDLVKKDQILFTIDSPDLVQAESNLIGAAATYDQDVKALARAQKLYATQGAGGISEQNLEAAVQAKLSAEGTLKAARDAVRVFGKTEAEIDSIVAQRRIDPALVVNSPIAGRITARNASPGFLEQPGNPPAPYTVADMSTKWMVANVTENDSPLYREGQPIQASLVAYPGRVFDGRISRLGRSLDPNTHRNVVRCDIADPKDELIPGMLATFTIQVHAPVNSIAMPVNGIVRNGDGSFAAWVTTDRHSFTERFVKIGDAQDGLYPVLQGLQRGEMVVTDGAVFLSNILYAPPSD